MNTINQAALPVYEVSACAETGEWLGEPRLTSEHATRAAWDRLEDADDCHHATYEHESETRLVRVMLVFSPL